MICQLMAADQTQAGSVVTNSQLGGKDEPIQVLDSSSESDEEDVVSLSILPCPCKDQSRRRRIAATRSKRDPSSEIQC